MSHNLSDRLYELSDNIGGGFTADEAESCAKHASEIESKVEQLFDFIDAVNEQEHFTPEMFAEVMKELSRFKTKLGRNINIDGSLEVEDDA